MRNRIWILTVIFATALAAAVTAGDAPEFSRDVAPILAKHCLSCHGHEEPEGVLVLERHASLMKGGESGPAIVAGKSDASLLVRLIEGKAKGIMPPGKRKKLDAAEIELIRKWIDAGALAPKDDAVIAAQPIVPKIKPKVPPKKPVLAIAESTAAKLVAVARRGEIELRDATTLAVKFTLGGHTGAVNALAFSKDGKLLASGAGAAGVAGEIKIWNTADGVLLKSFAGHGDAIYAVAISPDGKVLATGSYDQKIILWNIEKFRAGETPAVQRTLQGHNGAIFALAFRADGKVLASASGDRTVKLWATDTGQRLDTLSQPLKDQFTLAFSPDGTRLIAGGADNRIRLWKIGETALDGTNPMQEAIYAHDGAILRLVYSPDGKTIFSSGEDRAIKVWDADKVVQKAVFDGQPDWVTALAVSPDGKNLLAGRLDGSFALLEAGTGKVLKPELTEVTPRGVQRGVASVIKLRGKNLLDPREIKFNNPKIKAAVEASNMSEASVKVTADADLARGLFEVSIVTAGGETVKQSILVDDLPQIVEMEKPGSSDARTIALPATYWGEFNKPGDVDSFAFDAKGGQTIVFDIATASFKSKARVLLTLIDSSGLALTPVHNDVSMEPLLAFTIPKDGRYTARLSEATLAGSKEHYYRVSAGELKVVMNVYPLAVPARAESEVQLRGFNLPPDFKVKVNAAEPGEAVIALDMNVYRARTALKVLATDLPNEMETEPNDTPAQATAIGAPGSAEGRIAAAKGASDIDLFCFETKAGKTWIIETLAAQRGSPVDTKIEILNAMGKPVPRVQLRAVRDSYINFRGIDSAQLGARLKNWEEMELNNYVYLQGEVCRLFRMPQGPDSDLLFYKTGSGARQCYFDTSGTAHANEETVYIVEPHAVGEKLIPNGLPVFTLNYVNDDDGGRKLGSDSRLTFTPPADGVYFVRVTDSRGQSGEDFAYHLAVRDPKPDFNVSVAANPAINVGSGRDFVVSADRGDGFDGEIRIDVTGMPPGFSVSTPVVIQAGQREASGNIFVEENAAQPTDAQIAAVKLTATAEVNGKSVVKNLANFGKLKIEAKPKLYVTLAPYANGDAHAPMQAADPSKPAEITIAPGQTLPVWLAVKRNGHEDLITFSVDNLPHGVIVDDIGLSGVLLEKGLSERRIFLTCARWVPETDRLCFSVENQAGKQTSRPVMLHVRKK